MGYTKPKKVYKIIVAGNGGIGKTTLLKNFCYNEECCESEKLTVGSEIFIKKFRVDGREEYMQIWDLGGQEHFRFFLEDLIRGAHGAILGFDIKRRNSFIDMKKWLELLRKANPDMPIVLVATKKDLGYHPTLRPAMAECFMEENGLIAFYEISTKDKVNIEAPFKELIKHLDGCSDTPAEFLDDSLHSSLQTSSISH